MSEVADLSSRICKAEACELEGIHLAHDVTPFHVSCEVCSAPAGKLCSRDPSWCARLVGPYHHKRILMVRAIDGKGDRGLRDPWTLSAPEALDDSIVRVASDGVPRILTQLVPLIENDYGQIAPTPDSALKQLQRRVKRVCETGRLLRVDLGRRLYAYVAPDARIARNVDAIRERVMESFDREPKFA